MNDITLGPFLIFTGRREIGVETAYDMVGVWYRIKWHDWRTGLIIGPTVSKRGYNADLRVCIGPLKIKVFDE